MADENALTLESAPSLNDYRSLREGKPVEKVTLADKPSEAPPVDPAAAETAGDSETSGETVEEQNSEDGDGEKSGKPPAKRGLVDEVVKLRRKVRELEGKQAAPPAPQPQQAPAPATPETKRAAAPVPPPADDPEPDVSKFTDYNLYNRELVRWELRQARRQEQADSARSQAENAERSVLDNWQTRLRTAAAKPELKDFDAIAMDRNLPVTRVMGDVIKRSEVGPEVLYHLGLNPAEALRIAKLDPIDQIKEIGWIEREINKPDGSATAVEDESIPPKAAISKAPAPIPRPSGAPPRTLPSSKNLEGIPLSEYRALREAGRL